VAEKKDVLGRSRRLLFTESLDEGLTKQIHYMALSIGRREV
jgi:hypothetical protein